MFLSGGDFRLPKSLIFFAGVSHWRFLYQKSILPFKLSGIMPMDWKREVSLWQPQTLRESSGLPGCQVRCVWTPLDD
jgi:hypothetical protein